mmetsp:Transcript_31618/g.47780  ORF Transcript_31618/g.47780 Transcript_31618/m.47780 type:complete len:347 (+) Transcript_31618:1880-2920(+)
MIRDDWASLRAHHSDPYLYNYHHENARHSTGSFRQFHTPFAVSRCPPYTYNFRSPAQPFHPHEHPPTSPYTGEPRDSNHQEVPERFPCQEYGHSPPEKVKEPGSPLNVKKRKSEDLCSQAPFFPSPVESRAKRAKTEKASNSPISVDSNGNIAMIPSSTESENHMEPSVATIADFENECYNEEYTTGRHPYYFYHYPPYNPMPFDEVRPSETPNPKAESDKNDRKPAAKEHKEGALEDKSDEYLPTSIGPTQKEIEEAGPPRAVAALRVWYHRFQELVEFKRKYGHCNVRQKYKENPALGIWVNKQRCSRETLSEEKYGVLESINFDWGTKKGEQAWAMRLRSSTN